MDGIYTVLWMKKNVTFGPFWSKTFHYFLGQSKEGKGRQRKVTTEGGTKDGRWRETNPRYTTFGPKERLCDTESAKR